jgi:bacterial/archaeal transporter family protein
MVGYSLVTLFVKLATRNRQFSSFLVLAIATTIVCTSTLCITALRGDARSLVARDFASSSALWAYATGIALTVAVASLFRALSLGPASVVVPIYGMFIVGGARSSVWCFSVSRQIYARCLVLRSRLSVSS